MTVPPSDTARPRLTWELIEVGATYAEVWIDVTADALQSYASAVRYASGGAAMAGRAAHMMMASWTIPRVSFHNWKVPDGALHAGQSWRFERTARIGDKLHLTTTADEKFEARDRSFVVFRSEIVDEAGARVGAGTMTMVWPR